MHADPHADPNPTPTPNPNRNSFTLYPPLPLPLPTPTQSSIYPNNNTGSKRTVCVFYAQGRCSKGALCRFSHDDANPFSLFNAADYFPTLYPPPGNGASNGLGLGNGGGSAGASRTFKELQHRTKLCSFYLAGKCNRGDRCTFLHDAAALEAGITAEDVERDREFQRGRSSTLSSLGGMSRPDGWTKLNVTCKFWLVGRCRKDDMCPFRHEEPELELENVYVLPRAADRARPRSLSLVQLESLILKDGSSLLSPVSRLFRSGSETSEEPEGSEESESSSPSPPALSSGTSETGEDAVLPQTPGVEQGPHEDVIPEEDSKLPSPVLEMQEKELEREEEETTVTRTFFGGRGTEVTATFGDGLVVLDVLTPLRAPPSHGLASRPPAHTCLRLTFSTPTRTAHTTYASARIAQKEAHRVDGRVLRGRKLAAKSNTSGGSFAASVSGLPADVSKEEVQKLTKASSVTLYEPTFEVPDAVRELREEMESLVGAELDAFDVVVSLEGENKIVVYARCRSDEAAAAAVDGMKERKLNFLPAGHTLSVERVYAVKYTVLPRWADLNAELEAIGKTLDEGVRLRIPLTEDEPLWVESAKRESLLTAKKEIERLLAGRTLVLGDENDGRWFTSAEGRDLLAEVEKQTGAHVHLDERRRTLTVFASSDDAARLADTRLQAAFNARKPAHAPVSAPIFMTRSELGPSDQCEICSRPATDADALRSSACGHSFCNDCIRHYILSGRASTLSLSRAPLNCPAVSCSGLLPISLVRHAVPDETEFGALLEAAFVDYVRARPHEFGWCPTTDCWTIYRSGEEGDEAVQCPACKTKMCTACHVEMHDGFSCAEHRTGLVENIGEV